MYAQILAAIVLIPFGLNTLMRGSDGLNRGHHGSGEAGTMALSGAGMILSGVALLLGALVAGVLAELALLAATIVWVRQRRRALGRLPNLSDSVGRLFAIASITALIVLGWQ